MRQKFYSFFLGIAVLFFTNLLSAQLKDSVGTVLIEESSYGKKNMISTSKIDSIYGNIFLKEGKIDRVALYKFQDSLRKFSKSISQTENYTIEAVGDGTSAAKLPIVVQPSPNSIGLTKEVQENVDLYTGKLGVSLPIYTYKGTNIEVPISLSYNAGGHRVDDIAAWVGLGWNLNAGGSVTRVMHNLPDEFLGTVSTQGLPFAGYGYLNLKGGPEYVNLSNFDAETPTRKQQIIDYANWHQEQGYCYEYGGQCSRAYDTQPDEFYFSFGKYSGKFVFDQDGNINIISKQNLKISKTTQTINSLNKLTNFEIITEDGFIYQFGGFEKNAVEESRLTSIDRTTRYEYLWLGQLSTSPYEHIYFRKPGINITTNLGGQCEFDDFSLNGQIQVYHFFPSTWNLTKIISPLGDEVVLNYVDNGELTYDQSRTFNAGVPNFVEHHITTTQGSGWAFLSQTPPTQRSSPCFANPYWRYNQLQTFGVTQSIVTLKSKRLSSISSSNGQSVSFDANTLREDIAGDKRLDFIRIYDGIFNIKSFKLDYETITTTEGSDMFDLYNDLNGNIVRYYTGLSDNLTKRLFLKSVQELGPNLESIPATLFNYDNGLLPKRTSLNQDKFGYANTNSSQAPFSDVQYTSTSNTSVPTGPGFGGSNKTIFGWRIVGQQWDEPYTTNIRNPWSDLTRMSSGVLKKITYPTGGFKEFTYDINGANNIWTGLKISSIKNTDEIVSSNLPVITNYSFSSFQPTDNPILKYGLQDYFYEARFSYTSSRFNPSMTTKGNTGGYGSAEISQPSNGKTKVDYYTAADFADQTNTTYIEDGSGSTPANPAVQFPFAPKNSIDWQRGLIKKEQTLNSSGTLLKETIYSYDFNPVGVTVQNIPCLTPGKVMQTLLSGTPWKFFVRNISLYTSKWAVPTSRKERIYDQNGTTYSETEQITSYKNYLHNGKEYLFPFENKTINYGRGENLVQRTSYPLDYSPLPDDFGAGIINLKTKNVLTAPIEQYSFLQNPNGTNIRFTGGVLNKYHQARPMPMEVYKLKTNGLLTSFAPSNANGTGFNRDINYKSEMEFVYNSSGRVIQQNKTNNIFDAYKWGYYESYMWGYNNNYPVAKITNSPINRFDYTSFEGDSYTTTNILNSPSDALTGKAYRQLPFNDYFWFGYIQSNTEYKFTYWSKGIVPAIVRDGFTLESLTDIQLLKSRNGWNFWQVTIPSRTYGSYLKLINNTSSAACDIDELRLYPAQAQMSTYTFSPLIGMTSESDINGKTTYYEYDALNRLSIIRDDNKFILKTFCYNYASQPVSCISDILTSCSAPVINSAVKGIGFSIVVDYTTAPGATSCRIEVRNNLSGTLISFINSPTCASPVIISVPGTGTYSVTAISYFSQCPSGVVSEPVIVRVKSL